MKKLKIALISISSLLVMSCNNQVSGDESDEDTPLVPSEDEGDKKEEESLKKENKSLYTYHDLAHKTFSNTFFAPSTGDVNVLVVPVVIKGYESNATEEKRNSIENLFFGESNTHGLRESVSSYFYKSSFGSLRIGGEVTPWINIDMGVDDVFNASTSKGDYGTYEVVNRVYEELQKSDIDLTNYDSDKDGYIDCLYLVHSAPTKAHTDLVSEDNPENPFISFTYWDYDLVGAESDVPLPNSYSWVSYDLMEAGRSAGIELDAHTYIHEMGHNFGLVDYYDYDGLHSPLGCFDMQDFNVGDHNSYSKYVLGWTAPYFINKDSKITLKPASKTGDFIIIKNSDEFSGSAFDEYYILEYLTPTDLWEQDSSNAYPNVNTKTFTKPGIRMLHVDGRLLDRDGNLGTKIESSIYGQAFSNTPSRSMVKIKNQNQNKFDLISILNANKSRTTQTSPLTTASNSSLFTEGQIFTCGDYSFFFENGKLHSGESFPFKITFGEMNEEGATLTIKLVD